MSTLLYNLSLTGDMTMQNGHLCYLDVHVLFMRCERKGEDSGFLHHNLLVGIPRDCATQREWYLRERDRTLPLRIIILSTQPIYLILCSTSCFRHFCFSILFRFRHGAIMLSCHCTITTLYHHIITFIIVIIIVTIIPYLRIRVGWK